MNFCWVLSVFLKYETQSLYHNWFKLKYKASKFRYSLLIYSDCSPTTIKSKAVVFQVHDIVQIGRPAKFSALAALMIWQ